MCALQYKKDYELMISVRLVGPVYRCESQSQITPALFARYPTLEAMAGAEIADVEQLRAHLRVLPAEGGGISSTPARCCCGRLRRQGPGDDAGAAAAARRRAENGESFAGRFIPACPAVLCAIPIASASPTVLGLAQGKEPEKVERQLREILPPEESSDFCHRLVLHGRAVCTARKPDCAGCTLAPWCAAFGKEIG